MSVVKERRKFPCFWQVSDKVPACCITSVTHDCPEENCSLSARVDGQHAPLTHYGKYGQLLVTDNSEFSVTLCCKTCWRSWRVDEAGYVLEKIGH